MTSPLPLFPLNAVLVPGLVMPLHIFEPRYRVLVESLLAVPDEDAREFGIVAVRDGRDIARDGVAALYPVGTAVLLRQAERFDDGRYDIVTTGSRRFRVREIDASAPLVQGQVDFLGDITGPDDVVQAVRAARLFAAYRLALGGRVADDDFADESVEDLPDDPTVLSYLVTAAMVLPMQERQDLLGAETTGARLALARTLLWRETGLITALGAVPALDLVNIAPTPN